MFRHTYCAARLRTLDQGAPVSVHTVAKEMGHGGESMVRRVCGASRRCARLAALRARSFGTTIDTTAVDSQPSRANRLAAKSRA